MTATIALHQAGKKPGCVNDFVLCDLRQAVMLTLLRSLD
jgi:hypothetical protein